MSEDLEITFGRTVLVEKRPNEVISIGVNHLCRENIYKSHLHCFVSSSGWLITIRYVHGVALCGPEYSSFRIIMIKKHNKEISNQELTNNNMLYVLYINSNHKTSCSALTHNIRIIDSAIIVCHKTSLVQLLKHTLVLMLKESKKMQNEDKVFYEFGFNKLTKFTHTGQPPCIRATMFNNCSIFYGGNKKIQKQFSSLRNFKELKEHVNRWLKEQNKAKYETGNSIIIKPI